ncbi:hypothetical protein [Halalkalicoccus salilacus]|uniref:hypothetical protein n=1 Tax=Halalkalicoccus salilacus TaxID=3117459 RepID=UPI00300F3D68
MADGDDDRHRLSFKVEDEEGRSPEAAVTIDGEAIDEPQTAENKEGYVSFRVPNGTYEVVDIDAQGYTIDEDVVADLENGPTIESIVLTDNGDE